MKKNKSRIFIINKKINNIMYKISIKIYDFLYDKCITDDYNYFLTFDGFNNYIFFKNLCITFESSNNFFEKIYTDTDLMTIINHTVFDTYIIFGLIFFNINSLWKLGTIKKSECKDEFIIVDKEIDDTNKII